ncbi:MAG: hypothetical protein K9I85_06650 [Saprospiraceae bacterium]|nr:hypothetical protein [Saprospiraceae bacterium]
MVTLDTTPFKDFAPQSRTWIFQTTEHLSPADLQVINDRLTAFMEEWTAHQMQLTATFGIYFQHILVISIDQEGHHATGCSLDSLHQTIAALGQQLCKDFFDRLSIPLLINDEITFRSKKAILRDLASGELKSDTLMLDQTIQQLDAWKERWVVPISASWIKPLSSVS